MSKKRHRRLLVKVLAEEDHKFMKKIFEPVCQIADRVIYQAPAVRIDKRQKRWEITIGIDEQKAVAGFVGADKETLAIICNLMAAEILKFIINNINSPEAQKRRKGPGLILPDRYGDN